MMFLKYIALLDLIPYFSDTIVTDDRIYKTLAFVIGSPQQPPTESQFEDFSAKVYGTEPTMGQTAAICILRLPPW